MASLDKNAILKDLNENYSLNDIAELYKALIAREIGLETITDKDNEKLDKILDWYYDTDYLINFINEDIYDYAWNMFHNDEEESE